MSPTLAAPRSAEALSPGQRWQEERMFFHDILNTASGLRGLAEMMGRSQQGTPPQLLTGVQALATQIVEEIQLRRDLLHAEHGSLVLDQVEADANWMLDHAIQHHQMRAESNQIRFETTFGPDIRLHSDPERVQRVLGILIKNAIEASNSGDVICISSTSTDTEWTVTIHNPGVISPDIREHLGQRGCTTRGAGRGVGLFMARLLLEQYLGGKIEWTSSPDSGTTFTLQLLIKQDPGTTPIPPDQQSPSTTSYRRILLVDDNAVNRKVASVMLKQLGLDHDVASNGQEAITLFKSNEYDLILMDCMMPQIDGFEATRTIRALEQSADHHHAPESKDEAIEPRHLPIIAMTAHTAAEDLDSCRDAGMNDYIAKPMKLPTLKALLEKWAPQDSGGNRE